MRAYVWIAAYAFRRYSTYRAAALSATFTNSVFGFLRAGVLIALWRARPSLGGYDVADAVTFSFLTQALIEPVRIFGGSLDLTERIRTGDVSVDLHRPVDLQGWWLADDAGRTAFAVLSRGVPPLVVGGLDPARQRTALARRIGVVFGQRTTLWWDLPLRDSLALIRHLYRVERAAHRTRLVELTELLDLAPFLETPVRQLSLGQRMRGDLAAALLHDPELLILDEPTIGLDVISKATVRGFLARLNAERGTTILLTTHDLGDIERLCRRVMVIDRGRLAHDGSLEDLRATADADRVLVVDLARPAAPIEVDGARVMRTDGPRQWLAIPPDQNAAAVVAAVAARHEVEDIALREPDIEDVVTRLYRTGIPAPSST